MSAEDKLIVALDVPNLKEAEELAKALSPAVKTFKIGKELFTSAGPDAVRMVHAHGGRVFLDLKFHDIPNTVGAACEAATRLGVWMMNVHALGGKAMMTVAGQAVRKISEELKIEPPKVIGVTVLTSLKDQDLREVGLQRGVKEEVDNLALLVRQCLLDGVVASGQEIELIRKVTGQRFLIVTPGVRPLWASHGDQKRIITPKEAIQKGADFVVVGRPITQDKSPREAAEKIIKEME
jgi:orotidine-5'-phosphate decarboxylase